MVEFERGGTNVYADLGFPDAEEMLGKARLATKIGEIVKARRRSRRKAAEVAGLAQPMDVRARSEARSPFHHEIFSVLIVPQRCFACRIEP